MSNAFYSRVNSRDNNSHHDAVVTYVWIIRAIIRIHVLILTIMIIVVVIVVLSSSSNFYSLIRIHYHPIKLPDWTT